MGKCRRGVEEERVPKRYLQPLITLLLVAVIGKLFISNYESPDLNWEEPQLLLSPAGRISCLVFGADETFFWSGGAEGVLQQWEIERGSLLATVDLKGPVLSLDLSDDGERLAALTDSRLVILDAYGGRILSQFDIKDYREAHFWGQGLALVGSASVDLVSLEGDSVRSIEVVDEQPKGVEFKWRVFEVAFSPTSMAVGRYDGQVMVYREDGSRLGPFEMHDHAVSALLALPNGDWLSADWGGWVKRWNEKGESLWTSSETPAYCRIRQEGRWQIVPAFPVERLAAPSNGLWFWICTPAGIPVRWSFEGESWEQSDLWDWVSPSGNVVVARSYAGLRLMVGGEEALIIAEPRELNRAEVAQDGSRFLLTRGSEESWMQTYVWDLRNGRLEGYTDGMARASAKGRIIIRHAWSVSVWDPGSVIRRLAIGFQGEFVVSEDGKELLAVGPCVSRFELDNGRQLLKESFGDNHRLIGPSRWAYVSDALGPLWGRPRAITNGLEQFKVSWPVEFYHDGVDRAVGGFHSSCSGNDYWTLWSARTDEMLSSFRGKPLHYSSDGLWVAAQEEEGHTFIVDAVHGRLRGAVKGAPLGFNSDGTVLILRSGDTVSLLEMATFKDLVTVEVPGFDSATLTPDKKVLVTIAGSRCQFFRIADGEPLGQLLLLNSNEDWIVMAPSGHFDGTSEAFQRLTWAVGTERHPLSQFEPSLRTPGLLGKILRGESLELDTELHPPPQVELTPSAVRDGVIGLKVRAYSKGGGSSNLRLYHNGALLPPGRNDRYQVHLEPGRNEFRALADDSRGTTTSRPVTLTIDFQAGK